MSSAPCFEHKHAYALADLLTEELATMRGHLAAARVHKEDNIEIRDRLMKENDEMSLALNRVCMSLDMGNSPLEYDEMLKAPEKVRFRLMAVTLAGEAYRGAEQQKLAAMRHIAETLGLDSSELEKLPVGNWTISIVAAIDDLKNRAAYKPDPSTCLT